MTENTMTKWKDTKGQTMIYKTLHRKLKIEQHESPLLITGSPTAIQIKLNYKRHAHICFHSKDNKLSQKMNDTIACAVQ